MQPVSWKGGNKVSINFYTYRLNALPAFILFTGF
jgi:hypothetical protein